MQVELDRGDVRILDVLQQHGDLSAADVAEVPLPVRTITSTVPATCAGLVATICVAEFEVIVACVGPKKTVPLSRLDPVIVTAVPPV